MSDIKKVKVDPTGFFLKEDDTLSHASLGDSSDSSLDDYMPSKSQDLVHLQTSPNVTVIKEGGSTEPTAEPVYQPEPVTQEQAGGYKKGDIENYLKIKEDKDDDGESVNSTYSEKDLNSDEVNVEPQNEFKEQVEEAVVIPRPPPDTPTDSQNEYYTDSEEEIVDMTENKFYEVLASVLEDEEGENVAENMAKLNRNLEKHNSLMEQILREMIKSNAHNENSSRMIETLNNSVNNQTKILKSINAKNNNNSNAIIEETVEESETVQDGDNEEDEDNNDKKNKKRRIERMKHRIGTPEIKNLRISNKN